MALMSRTASMSRIKRGLLALGGAAAALSAACGAASAEVIGKSTPGEIGFEPAASQIARDIFFFHNAILLPIITAVCLFVLALLIAVMVKFNERANPTPTRTTHHTGLEVAWTIIPVLILVVIAIPSFRLLSEQLILPKGDFTIKVTGHQWYWSYNYPKSQDGGFGFDSFIKADKDLKPGQPRLLTVDNEVVVPVGKTVILQVTSTDVIHSFFIPSFGVHIDAIPGRLNQTWFKADRRGVYYGQCSNICGKDHAFMPIVFRVVGQKSYQAWLAGAKKKFASLSAPASGAPVSFAFNDPAQPR